MNDPLFIGHENGASGPLYRVASEDESVCVLFPYRAGDTKDGDLALEHAALHCVAPALLAAAREFCAKVDRGEAKSRRSYAEFAAIIEKFTELQK